MTDFTPERIAQLREILAKATPGEWETDTEKTDGEYGSGPDCHSGYHASIITAGDKRICGTENSSDGEVHEEFDEDGCYAWDEVAARNMKAAAHAVNVLPAALDEIERLRAERDAWRENAIACGKMLQSFTPGGSEYFGKRIGGDYFATDEKACGAVIRSKLDALHKARCEAVNTARELSRVTAERDEAVSTLVGIEEYWNGSRTDWAMFNALEVIGERARAFLSRMEGRKDG